MKIYVASSWRNTVQPDVVAAFRRAGHEVYDFRHPRPGDNMDALRTDCRLAALLDGADEDWAPKHPCERCGTMTSVQPWLCVDCFRSLAPAAAPAEGGGT